MAKGFWRTPQASEAGAKVETLYTKDGKPAKIGERAYRKTPTGEMVLQSQTINQQIQMEEPRESTPSSQLTLFAEGSPANRSLLPGNEEAQKMTVASGQRCYELYGKFSPLGSLAKMLLESSIWNSTRCFLTWKVRDIKRRRFLFQLAVSMPRTEGIGSGLWPTSSSRDWKDTPGMSKEGVNPDGSRRERTDQLARAVYDKMWPTPDASDRRSMKSKQQGLSNKVLKKEGINRQTGSLNPDWVEWLMGFPVNYTEIKEQDNEALDSKETSTTENTNNGTMRALQENQQKNESPPPKHKISTKLSPNPLRGLPCKSSYVEGRQANKGNAKMCDLRKIVSPERQSSPQDVRERLFKRNRQKECNAPVVWEPEPDIPRVSTGIPDRTNRLKALGNAVVPQIPEILGMYILESERAQLKLWA